MIVLGIQYCKETPESFTQKHLKKVYQIDKNPFHFKVKDVDIWVARPPAWKSYGDILQSSSRLLIGKAFLKNGDVITESSIVWQQTDLKDFTTLFWGQYIVFDINENEGILQILRDPTCMIDLFYTKESPWGFLFSTELHWLHEMLPYKPSLDLTYVASFLLHGNIVSSDTPFRGIQSLTQGCVLELKGGCVSTTLVWKPWVYFVSNAEIPSEEEVITTLLKVVINTTEDAEHLYLDYSGGLDSTALLYSLKNILRPTQSLNGLHIFHPKIDSSNEWDHASPAAQHAGMHLIPFSVNDNLPFSQIDLLQVPPHHPHISLVHLKMEKSIASLIQDTNNTVFVNGEGGDHLFMCPPAMESICDVLLDGKITLFYPKLLELATYFRRSIFVLLAKGLPYMAHYLFKQRYPSIIMTNFYTCPWFGDELKKLARRQVHHPFYDMSFYHCYPGKFYQIDAFHHAIASIQGQIRHASYRVLYPLMSQPIVELALRFPTYSLYKDGYDRWPLRNAISNFFQTPHVWRHDKGDTTGVMQLGLKKNKKEVLKFCLEGRLVREKLINPERLEYIIQNICAGDAEYMWSLVHHLSMEIFLSHFK